jgi:hypothetical protein
MLLSKKSVETLIDLIEIKLSCIEVFDTHDTRTVKHLEQCRAELYELTGKAPQGEVVPLPGRAVA